MEEVDGIILRRLTEIGCDLPSDVKSIKNLATSDFTEAIVRCLRLINPDVSLTSSKLPENVAARFRFATSLADAVAGLGYKGNIGYQMILYGSEADIRRLLMFLMEKLPKDTAASSALANTTISKLDLAKRIAAERLRQELKQPYAPWFCKTQETELRNLYWRQPYYLGDLSFKTDDIALESDLMANLRRFRHIPGSVLAMNTRLFASDEIPLEHAGMDDVVSLILHVQNAAMQSADARTVKKIKPPLMPKPTSLSMKPIASEVRQEPVKEEEAHAIAAQEFEKRMESLTTEISSLEAEVDQQSNQEPRLQQMLQKIINAIQTTEYSLPSKHSELNQLRLMADLAPNVDEHIKQLRDYIGKSDARLEKLAATKDELCTPLHKEIAEIKQSSLTKPESERLSDEISTSERKTTEIAEEMQAKKGHLQALKREYEKMEKDINRAYYTKRILEIVANVNKQKQEIMKVLEEIRSTQKDVNMLSGKLERSFTAADELLYKDATRDDFIKRAYKCFVSLHENCAKIISHIENAGHLEREMRDLDDQINTETQRSVDATLETLVNDYCEMKEANESLFAKLKQYGVNISM